MSMTGVLRPGHVQLRVLDIEEAVVHYRDYMGLIETHRDDQGRIYLKGWCLHLSQCFQKPHHLHQNASACG